MKIDTFLAERWMDEYDSGIVHNLNTTCPLALSLDELIQLCGLPREAVLDSLASATLGYGPVRGIPDLLAGLSALYTQVGPGDILTTHGATGANHLALWALIEPGDRVVAVTPAYQQLYSIPQGFGARVDRLETTPQQAWLPDLDRLEHMARGGLKLICLGNPGNPTGSLMPPQMLADIADIARRAGAWVLCDEAYRSLTREDDPSPSMADLYEKGISVSSMSKAFSMPGLRLGWVASRDRDFMAACLHRRDYNTITCGVLDEAVAALAAGHRPAILGRNLAHLRRNLAVLDSWMAGQPGLSWVPPHGGTTALILYSADIPSRDLCRRLLDEAGVYVIPGDCFDVPRSLRIGFAGPTAALEAGLAALGGYLAGL